MRIGIFGSYNHTSIGDHAILEGILVQFRTRLGHCSFVVFSMNPDATQSMLFSCKDVHVVQGTPARVKTVRDTQSGGHRVQPNGLRRLVKRCLSCLPWPIASFLRRFYSGSLVIKHDVSLLCNVSFWRQIKKEIQSLNVLLIGGGNLLMDIYTSWPVYPLIYVILATRARVPVMFYAVGAGPLRSRRARFYFRWACRMAGAITLRDKESLDFVAETLGLKRDKLVLSADPALCLSTGEQAMRAKTGGQLRIAMTVVPYYRPGYWPYPDAAVYERYCRAMAQIVERVLDRFDARLLFFATNTHDIAVAPDVAGTLGACNRVEVIEDRLTVQELLSLLANCHLTIGTRLHSLILSFVAGTPALAFSYQPKVTYFYKRIGMEMHAIHLNRDIDVSPIRVIHLLNELHRDREAIRAHMRRELTRIQTEAQASVDITVRLAKGVAG